MKLVCLIVRWTVRKIALAYFNRQLDRGNYRGFYDLSGPWNTGTDSVSLGIGDATWEVQDRLVTEFGLHRCPSCKWATEQMGEHLLTAGSWCLEQVQARSQKFYFLEKRLEPGRFDQIGIVIADSVEHAAHQLRMGIVSVVRPPYSAELFAELENDYCLSGVERITIPLFPRSQ